MADLVVKRTAKKESLKGKIDLVNLKGETVTVDWKIGELSAARLEKLGREKRVLEFAEFIANKIFKINLDDFDEDEFIASVEDWADAVKGYYDVKK